MSQAYNDLVSHALAEVRIAQNLREREEAENFKAIVYLPLLRGDGNWEISVNPDAGHNFYAIVDAIHILHKENPEEGYNIGFEDGLCFWLGICASDCSFDQVFRYIYYQLELEQNNRATFFIDKARIAKAVRENINNPDRRKILRKNSTNFIGWLDRQRKYCMNEYDFDIIGEYA